MPGSSSRQYHSYFIPGYRLSKHVMINQVQLFVGHDYTIRPFTYHHREGYLLTHCGPPLTRVSPRSQSESERSQSTDYEDHRTRSKTCKTCRSNSRSARPSVYSLAQQRWAQETSSSIARFLFNKGTHTCPNRATIRPADGIGEDKDEDMDNSVAIGRLSRRSMARKLCLLPTRCGGVWR